MKKSVHQDYWTRNDCIALAINYFCWCQTNLKIEKV